MPKRCKVITISSTPFIFSNLLSKFSISIHLRHFIYVLGFRKNDTKFNAKHQRPSQKTCYVLILSWKSIIHFLSSCFIFFVHLSVCLHFLYMIICIFMFLLCPWVFQSMLSFLEEGRSY